MATLAAGCGESGSSSSGGGTGSSATITAPGIVSPNSTTPIFDSEPTLTVTNATVSTGATPTYTFQVATDQGFSSIVVQASGIVQGSGQTSWDVGQPLNDGSYFWRARAEASGTSSPFSSVAQFAVLGLGGPGETILVNDPLTNGSSLAIARDGGTFTSEGWRVVENGNFLRYEVPTIMGGYVQWQNLGLTPEGVADSHMLLGMWDPTAGNYRTNAYRVHIRKVWPSIANPPYLRLRWIAQGRQEEDGTNFTGWDPTKWYTWRVDWGPHGETNFARVFLDGDEIMSVEYEFRYLPETHWIELGIQERGESVIGATYRNFAAVRRR